MSTDLNESVGIIDASLGELKALERSVLDLFSRRLSMGGNVYIADWLLVGAAHRTIAQSSGFRALISARNFTCATGITRMQLDTVLRLHAGFLYGDLNGFSQRIFDNESVRNLRDKSGRKMQDKYLKEDLSRTTSWIGSVYDATSTSIHLSRRHIQMAIQTKSGEGEEFTFRVGPSDKDLDPQFFIEACEGFKAITRLVIDQMSSWLDSLEADFPDRLKGQPVTN